ncbi:28S ribosomal S10, mitochondrial [Pelobates cultripes]|uniref:Small ribosomal subunit protein uS10m n=1 Tax=Pelobates cultripes TaxID=61616 RepID=A0AAD1RH74_PELCU|nr:28S ribosomal S10, mitochondrial [Pelobates cultripes]
MSVCVVSALLSRSVRTATRWQILQILPSCYCTCALTSRFSQLRNVKSVLRTSSAGINTNSLPSRIQELITINEEPDVLYKKIEVLAKCHDKSVLDSYEYFVVLAAKELGISLVHVYEPKRKIERFTLLKSVHIFKKHRVQYEMRTHYRCFELKHITGSTANVYLEYIQRNLPEGAALEITKTTLEKLPDHIKYPVWDQLSKEENEKTTL